MKLEARGRQEREMAASVDQPQKQEQPAKDIPALRIAYCTYAKNEEIGMKEAHEKVSNKGPLVD